MKKKLLLVATALLFVPVLSACSEIAEADMVGLWYAQGQFDGNHFDHCVKPGTTDEVSWNDSVYWVPANVRTWNVAPSGGDTNQALVVLAKPEPGQQSGREVLVWTQTNFKLNTYCGGDNKDANSPLVKWWENLGKRYNAVDEAGWDRMLNNTIVPALEKAKNVLRDYTSDELVQGDVWAQAEQKMASTFSTELGRLAGGNYFCSSSFDREKSIECKPVEVSIKDVDYRDPGIQEARNNTQKAAEQAQAKIIEAEGNLKAAQLQQQLYSNPAQLQIELEKLRLQMIQACAQTQKCVVIMDPSGSVQVHTS